MSTRSFLHRVAITALAALLLVSPSAVSAQQGVYQVNVAGKGLLSYRYAEFQPPLLTQYGLEGITAFFAQSPLKSAILDRQQQNVTFLELDRNGVPVHFELLNVPSYVPVNVTLLNGEVADVLPALSEADQNKARSLARLIAPGANEQGINTTAASLLVEQIYDTIARKDPRVSYDPNGLPNAILFPKLSSGVLTMQKHMAWRLPERPKMNGLQTETTINRSSGSSASATIGLTDSASFGYRSLSGSSSEKGGGGSAGFSLGPISIGGSAEAKSGSNSEREFSDTFSRDINVSGSGEVTTGVGASQTVTMAANTAYAFWSLWETTDWAISGTAPQTASVIHFVPDTGGVMRPVQRYDVTRPIRSDRLVNTYDDVATQAQLQNF